MTPAVPAPSSHAAGPRFQKTLQRVLPVTGRSPAIAEVYALVETLAGTDTTALITGESGVGKELIARLLYESGRERVPFLAHNCAAIAEGTLESDLFGHAAGSFTGAVRTHRGLFEEADGGVLFLDEIGEIGARLQAQLLRVLQEGEIRRVGESRSRAVDVRILAATNRDLAAEVQAGRFREDLYYRLNVVQIPIPPLRERRIDIPDFVHYFLRHSVRGEETPSDVLTPEAMELLLTYPWPGNIRQLGNEIERVTLLTRGRGPATAEHFSEALRKKRPSGSPLLGSLREQVARVQREIVLGTLHHHRWNKTRSARSLGVTRQGLIKMIHRLQIPMQPAAGLSPPSLAPETEGGGALWERPPG